MTINKMQITLRLAAIYNLLWGLVAVLYPVQCFLVFGMEPPLYPQLWQCIGMIVERNKPIKRISDGSKL